MWACVGCLPSPCPLPPSMGHIPPLCPSPGLQGNGYDERVMLIYDGLHYDALAVGAFKVGALCGVGVRWVRVGG